MSVPPEIAETARRWLRWASEDYSMARASHGTDEFVPRGVCMWSHQAAEKAVKALLVVHDIDPPKQHDLVRLTVRLPHRDQALFAGIDIEQLSRWAIEGRYPDDYDEATTAEAADALAQALDVLVVVRARLDEMTRG